MDLKKRILSGAEELFMRFGIKTITMDEVAKHLSVSKKTIYQHFADKNELVKSVLENHMVHEHNCFCQIHEGSENAIEEIFKISKFMKAQIMDINPSLLMDLQKYHPEAWQIFETHKFGEIKDYIIQNLEWGKRDGYFRSEINSEIITIFRLEQVEMGFNPLLFPSSKFSIIEVQIELLTHFIHGLLTQKGLDKYNEYIQSNA